MDLSPLSLFSYCIPCGAKCCKPKDENSSPIVSKEEADAILKFSKKNLGMNESVFKKINVGKHSYFIFSEFKDLHCPFLDKTDACMIQIIKPMDCATYPIKALYSGNEIKFVIDPSCPASKSLSKEFISNSKKAALKSLERFDKSAYLHWQNNFSGSENSSAKNE